MDNLFSTHPATENRIAALEQIAAQMGRGGFAREAPRYATPTHGPWGNTGGTRRGPWG